MCVCVCLLASFFAGGWGDNCVRGLLKHVKLARTCLLEIVIVSINNGTLWPAFHSSTHSHPRPSQGCPAIAAVPFLSETLFEVSFGKLLPYNRKWSSLQASKPSLDVSRLSTLASLYCRRWS